LVPNLEYAAHRQLRCLSILNLRSFLVIFVLFISTSTITEQKDQIKNLTQLTIEQQVTIASLQKIQDTLQSENETWKKNYTVAHNKLLSIEYEKSDTAKVDLQRENTLLKIEISKLKEEVSTTADYFREENVNFKRRCERTL